MPTVFEHIVSRRLSNEYENVATDALAFLLDQDDGARAAFTQFLRTAQPKLSDNLSYTTQESGAQIRPDISGTGPDGAAEVLIENKFWAGFTDQQPLGYLESLRDRADAGLVMFVVPEARKQTAWSELQRRAASVGETESMTPPPGVLGLLQSAGGVHMALTSWRHVLSVLELGIGEQRDRRSDLDQLRGLCERADAESFTPLGAAELSDQSTALRLLQYGDLVQEATQLAVADGIASVEGLRPTHFWTGFGRYLRVGGMSSWLGVDFERWRDHGRTPVWLRFEPRSERAARVALPLQEWVVNRDGLVVQADGRVHVAIDLLPGVERSEVAAGIVEQLSSIGGVISASGEPEAVEGPRDSEDQG